MKRILSLCVFIFSLSASVCATELSDLNDQVRLLAAQLKQLESNQVNYTIERDLLKETYSNNYQTINIILAIVLGVFSFISFFGIRDINVLRREYKDELEKLAEMRKELDVQISEIGRKQEAIVQQGASLAKANEEQDRRIKILELQEKASTFIGQNNYQRALEYLSICSDLDPNNVMVLTMQGTCAWRLRNYSSAIEKYEKLVSIDESNSTSYKRNLLELYLFNGNFDKFEKTNTSYLTDGYGSEITLAEYLATLKSYLQGVSIVEAVRKKLSSVANVQKLHFNWIFQELFQHIANRPESIEKKAIVALAQVIWNQKMPSVALGEIV